MREGLKRKAKMAAFSVACLIALVVAVANPLSPAKLLETVQPLPRPYDEQADAGSDLAGARARANASGRLLLIEYGGNWCPYCRAHAGLMATPEVQKVVSDRYEVVWVDVGRFDKNLHLYEPIAGELGAVPTSLIVDPGDGKLLNPGDLTIPDGDPREHSAEALAEWLLRHTRSPARTVSAQRRVIPNALPF